MIQFFSCTNDIATEDNQPELPTIEEKGITASVTETKLEVLESYDVKTRSNFIYDAKSDSMKFSWKGGDCFTVFSPQNSTANYTLTSGAQSTNASFSGDGFDLVEGSTYLAYSHSDNAGNDPTCVKLDYSSQVQIGNDNCDHLGALDYMHSKAVAGANRRAHFKFSHLGCVIRFELTAPEAGKYTKLVLKDYNTTSDKREFYCPYLTCDITAANPIPVRDDSRMNGTNKDDNAYYITLKGNDTTDGITVTESAPLIINMWIPTLDLKGQRMKAILTKENDDQSTKEFFTTFGATTFKGTKYYAIVKKPIEAKRLSITLRVDKDWKIGNTVSQTRAGDPGIDEKLPVPTDVLIYTCINNKVYNIEHRTGLKIGDWNINGNILTLKNNHIVSITEDLADNAPINVYAYAYNETSGVPSGIAAISTSTTEDNLRGMTFTCSTSATDQKDMRDLYSTAYTTPTYQGSVAYSSTEPMFADITLYHVAAKVDVEWDFSTTSSLSGTISANDIPTSGLFMFKPTENTSTSNQHTFSVDLTPGTKWIGRQVFYLRQPVDKTYKITLGTAANNVTFTNPVTNGWTSWLKANITPAPPAP